MKIGTEQFKEAVGKVIQGASFNKLLPITSMIGLKKFNDGRLFISTTDMTNSLDVIIKTDSKEEFDATIDAETFSKLVSKLTSEEVELSVEDSTLIVKANGTYKFPLISDEDGFVSFPVNENIDGNEKEVLLSTVMSVYNSNEPALAKTLEQPCFTGYYCGKETVSTDGIVITFNNKSISVEDNPLLISAQAMLLLTLNSKEKIKLIQNNDKLQFVTEDIIVTTSELEGIEDYPIEQINKYLEEPFNSKCKISKELLLDILDRLSLFVEPYDKNGAYFTFTDKGITIHSKKGASTETIKYIESSDFSSFICCVDIPAFKEQVQAIPEDTLTLSYGNENALRLDCEGITQIVALLEDEDLEA